jgi:hypothetical protein
MPANFEIEELDSLSCRLPAYRISGRLQIQDAAAGTTLRRRSLHVAPQATALAG